MNTKKTWITVLVITTLIIVIFTMISKKNNPSEPITTSTKNLVHTLTYACDAKRSMIVQYYELPPTEHNRSQTSSGQPSPTGSVTLSLSDGRSIYLAQTVSANGARYANANESIVFWSKGNGFTFTEKNIETYPGCIEVARASNGLSEIYESSTRGFSVRYQLALLLMMHTRTKILVQAKILWELNLQFLHLWLLVQT